MKKFLLISLTIFLSGHLMASVKSMDYLCEINPYWQYHTEYLQSLSQNEWLPGPRSDIRTHLALVEVELRSTVSTDLTAEQIANRNHCLDILHEYRLSGAFPINEFTSYRWPVFIDNYNNFCAVGHLLKETGYEELAREISDKNRLVLVEDIDDKRLLSWALKYGFEVDELAWIQPGYFPTNTFNSLGGGTDGNVYDMALDSVSSVLYVGGDFSMVDGSMMADNIAMWYPGFAGYSWLNLGAGLNGPVNALIFRNGELYAGGSFTDAGGVAVNGVARWDGTQWHAVGSNLMGSVYELFFYQGELYAGGAFGNTGPVSLFTNLAKFDGTQWVSTGGDPDGIVNVLEESNGLLIIGGNFSRVTSSSGNTMWPNITAYDGSSFSDLGNGIPATVTTLENFNGKLYAGGHFVNGTDTFGIASFDTLTSVWTNHLSGFGPSANFSQRYFCDFHAHSNIRLIMGGWFSFGPLFGVAGENLLSMDPNHYFRGEGLLDSTLNKLVYMNGEWFMGGYFTSQFGTPFNYIVSSPLNGPGSGIDDRLDDQKVVLHPNPASQRIFIKDQVQGDQILAIEIFDALGRLKMTVPVEGLANGIGIDHLEPGTYLTVMHRTSGARVKDRFVMQ